MRATRDNRVISYDCSWLNDMPIGVPKDPPACLVCSMQRPPPPHPHTRPRPRPPYLLAEVRAARIHGSGTGIYIRFVRLESRTCTMSLLTRIFSCQYVSLWLNCPYMHFPQLPIRARKYALQVHELIWPMSSQINRCATSHFEL